MVKLYITCHCCVLYQSNEPLHSLLYGAMDETAIMAADVASMCSTCNTIWFLHDVRLKSSNKGGHSKSHVDSKQASVTEFSLDKSRNAQYISLSIFIYLYCIFRSSTRS